MLKRPPAAFSVAQPSHVHQVRSGGFVPSGLLEAFFSILLILGLSSNFSALWSYDPLKRVFVNWTGLKAALSRTRDGSKLETRLGHPLLAGLPQAAVSIGHSTHFFAYFMPIGIVFFTPSLGADEEISDFTDVELLQEITA